MCLSPGRMRSLYSQCWLQRTLLKEPHACISDFKITTLFESQREFVCVTLLAGYASLWGIGREFTHETFGVKSYLIYHTSNKGRYVINESSLKWILCIHLTLKTPWWNWKSKRWFLWGSGSTIVPLLFVCFRFVFYFFFECQNCFSFSWVLPVVSILLNTLNLFSAWCVFVCVCDRKRDRARKSVSKYIIVNQRVSGLALIDISASFSKRVWWSSDWPGEDYSVSWVPRGVSGWADLLLAHTCAIRPKDPSELSGIWCGGRHGMSCRLPGGLWQLWRRLRLCWQVRITDQSINQKSDPNCMCACVYYWL